ncbi:MAG: hypothetical protein E6772_16835 [Dysgonomonas sp.]|nr:hypothetical protein [Dysgonomonas sp.]
MKKNFTLFSKISLLFLSVVLAFSACTEEKYYPTIENDDPVDFLLEFHDIVSTDWKWNDDRGRYEVVFNVPKLTKDMYDYGVINASVFVTYSDGYEVQTNLPYLETWEDNGVIFTETLKYDISYNDKTVAYYLQSSDLGRDDFYLPNYQIKLSYIYYANGY